MTGIKSNHIYLLDGQYIILANFFQVNVTSQSVVEVSENLRRIINNDTLNNSDIVLVTSVVKKIIESLKMTQKNENQVRFY